MKKYFIARIFTLEQCYKFQETPRQNSTNFTEINCIFYSYEQKELAKNSSTCIKKYSRFTTILKINCRTCKKFQETPRQNSMIFHWIRLFVAWFSRREGNPQKNSFVSPPEKTRGRNLLGGKKGGRTIGELNSPFRAVRDGSFPSVTARKKTGKLN